MVLLNMALGASISEDQGQNICLPSRAQGFPGGSDTKESACNAGDMSLIPGLGRSPGEGNGYPLQYSCLENCMDRGAWWAPFGHKEPDVTKQLTLSLSSMFQSRG